MTTFNFNPDKEKNKPKFGEYNIIKNTTSENGNNSFNFPLTEHNIKLDTEKNDYSHNIIIDSLDEDETPREFKYYFIYIILNKFSVNNFMVITEKNLKKNKSANIIYQVPFDEKSKKSNLKKLKSNEISANEYNTTWENNKKTEIKEFFDNKFKKSNTPRKIKLINQSSVLFEENFYQNTWNGKIYFNLNFRRF